MFIDLGNRVSLTDEQFQDEMRARVAANPGKDVLPGMSVVWRRGH